MKKVILSLILISFCLYAQSQELQKKLAIPEDIKSLEYFELKQRSNGEIKKLYYTKIDSSNGNHCLSIFDYKKNKYWRIYECFTIDTNGLNTKPFTSDTIYVNNGKVYDYDDYGRLIATHSFFLGKKSKYWTKIDYFANNNIRSISEMYDHYNMHGKDSNFYETGDLYFVAEYVENRLMRFITYLDPFGNEVDLVEFSNGNGCIPLYYECYEDGDMICFKNGKVRRRKNKKLPKTK